MAIRYVVLFVLVLGCSLSRAEEAVEIPLSEIWAQRIPDTKNVTELDPFFDPPWMSEKEWDERSAVRHILRVLNPSRRRENQKAPPGFAVKGTGRTALKTARDVLTNLIKPDSEFSVKDEITLVFFSYAEGAYFHLDEVVRHGTQVRINYHYVRHTSMNVTAHFGLIPLGRLPKDKYEVNLVMGPVQAEFGRPPGPPPPKKLIEQAVCQDFEFTVK